jgi:hypothetical protein
MGSKIRTKKQILGLILSFKGIVWPDNQSPFKQGGKYNVEVNLSLRFLVFGSR